MSNSDYVTWTDCQTHPLVPAVQQPDLYASLSADYGAFDFHGTPPSVGARMTRDTRCTNCGGPFLKDHVVRADLLPGMAGTFRHTDCDDPKLDNLDP